MEMFNVWICIEQILYWWMSNYLDVIIVSLFFYRWMYFATKKFYFEEKELQFFKHIFRNIFIYRSLIV